MDILRSKKTAIVSVVILIITVSILLVNSLWSKPEGIITLEDVNPDKKDIIEAFKNSYNYEIKGLLNKAIDELMEVYDRNNYEINLRLGWLYYQDKKYTESIGYYNNAINIMPYAIEAKFGLVLPAADAEDWVKVVEQYNAILQIDPQNTVANFRLGMIYYYKPDYELALKYFEKVGNLYPFDYDTILMMGWTNYQLGKTKEAKVLFERTLMIKPDDSSALEGLSLIK